MSSEKPVILNKQQIAYALDVTTNTVNRYQKRKDNPLPVLKSGSGRCGSQYDLRDVIDWHVQERINRILIERVGSDGDAPEFFNKEAEQARLFKEQADQTALKNAQTRKELAPISVIEWTLSSVGKQIAAMLDSIPQKVKRRVPKLEAKDIENIKREIRAVQNAASRIEVDFDDSPDGDHA